MCITRKCPIKINLTLRVLSKRPDNFHDIFSLFWKKNGSEGLTIRPLIEENIGDILHVHGANIEGPNIVARALDWVRSKGCPVPPLELELRKYYPQGSGVGAGSGNAAALIDCLRAEYGLRTDTRETVELGADVAFLSQDAELAFVRGIGEAVEPLYEHLTLSAVLAFPAWTSNTAQAYGALDAQREDGDGQVLTKREAEEEAKGILARLQQKDCVGFLPNDFYSLFRDKKEYQKAFDIARELGAQAWGLCGSGSALFALCAERGNAAEIERAYQQEHWVQKTDRVE